MKNILIPSIVGMSLMFSYTENRVYADTIHHKDQYVSKEQYEQLKAEMRQLKKQMQRLLQQQSPKITSETPVAIQSIQTQKQQTQTKQNIAELQEDIQTLKVKSKNQENGTTGFLLTGYAFAGYSNSKNATSSFNAGFNPIFLWRLRNDLIFEGELEFGLEEGQTEIGLEFAQLSYLMNDYMTIGAGQFLNPSNYFKERLHPAWINKLPDAPLTMNEYNGIQAGSQLGIQMRGGIPVGSMRGEYAFYVSNAPALRGDGSLNFNNFSNFNNNTAVGGRVGWLPFSGFEVGYGFEVANVNDLNGNTLGVITHAIDLNYLKSSKKYLLGRIDINAQYANRQIDRSSDPTLAFNNQSSGGYAQFAYRPSLSGISLLTNVESVLRYDWIDLPDASVFYDEQRWTLGLNYYIAASTLFKLAYQFDNKQGAINNNTLAIQLSSGF